MSVEVDAVSGLTAEVDVVLAPTTTVELVGAGTTSTVEIIGGVPGPPGPQGPPGPPGSGVPAHTHVQSVPAALWTITHALGYQPNITVVDSSNEQVEGDVIYGPVGTISLIFSAAFSGTAYLS